MRVEPACQHCGCARSAHYSELQSQGDMTREVVRRYYACLNINCECRRYVPLFAGSAE